jgi:uncharacterized protein (TIGR02996 family)
MTHPHDALYRAICAFPDEDTPRLAFADLVEEEGDGVRAAFIRAQVALARVPEYDALAVSARQLDPDAFHGWMRTDDLPPVPGGYSWRKFEFRRGFAWKVGVQSPAAFLGRGAAIFDFAPVQALDFYAQNHPDLAALGRWPHLGRIRRLEFSAGRFGAGACESLGHSVLAAGLAELAFESDESITAEGLEALARSPLFPRLSALELKSNAVPPALLVDALAAARQPGVLGRLCLANNHVTRHDADHLFALPVLHGLEHLDLSDNTLNVEGVQALAGSPTLRGLRVLKLARTLPGVPGVEALTQTGGLSGVRSLDLSANRLGPVAVKLVAESAAARGLRVLSLANNPVGDAGAAALAKSRALAGLLELDLADAELTDAGALALAESPNLGNLLRLNLASHTTAARPFGKLARAALRDRFGEHVTMSTHS